MSWPERFSVGVFVFLQAPILLLAAPDYQSATIWGWERVAVILTIVAWAGFRTLRFMFGTRP